MPLFTCPCCGHQTLPGWPGSYDLCPVCWWEDDGTVSTEDPYAWGGGPNGQPLVEAQRRYRLYGGRRAPTSEEPLDRSWHPVPPRDEPAQNVYLRDIGHRLYNLCQAAWDDVRRHDTPTARGRLQGLTQALIMAADQAPLLGLDRHDLGIPDIDLADEFSPDPRPGHFAG